MPKTPTQLLEAMYNDAKNQSIDTIIASLPDDYIQDLKVIVENAEMQKGVLGVTLTSIVYKTLYPSQDIRNHQEHMEGGYSGRTFDTKYITPFLKDKFPHYAMAESAWLTRSLEQHHPYNFQYPGNIRNPKVKIAFLNTLECLQTNSQIASRLLVALLSLLLQTSVDDESLFASVNITSGLTIARIIDAVSQHIRYDYGRGAVGTARIPVVAIYSVYNLLMVDVKRYSGKTLAPLEFHTSPDFRSKSLGDIEVLNENGSCYEAVEIKHYKPISADLVGVAFCKIKDTGVDRYYLLTTSEPNFDDYDAVIEKIEEYKRIHPCQIIVNGVIPSLKYYLRLVSNPQAFVDEYTKWLEFEYQRASGIKKNHLRIWQEIRQQVSNIE